MIEFAFVLDFDKIHGLDQRLTSHTATLPSKHQPLPAAPSDAISLIKVLLAVFFCVRESKRWRSATGIRPTGTAADWWAGGWAGVRTSGQVARE